MKFTWRNREYTEKDIIIWILAAVLIFGLSYTWHLENAFEEIDYDLQECKIEIDKIKNPFSYSVGRDFPDMVSINYTEKQP